MLEFLGYFWLFVVYGWINGFISIKLYKWNLKRKDTKFLRHLRIEHPESIIVVSAMESSDEAALLKIKEQLDELS